MTCTRAETEEQVIEEYTDNMAEGIQSLIFIFNPDYIVLGGDISQYSDVFSKGLSARIFGNNEFYKEGDVKILFSSLKDDSNILGAAILPVLDKLGF